MRLVCQSGKCWRLLKSWYEGATCQVKVPGEGMLSEPTLYGEVSSKGPFSLLLFSWTPC